MFEDDSDHRLSVKEFQRAVAEHEARVQKEIGLIMEHGESRAAFEKWLSADDWACDL